MQVIVDLTLVSFLLITSAPEQTPHCTNRGGELVKDHGAGDSGYVLTRAQASKTQRRDVASRRRLGHAKVPTYLPSCQRGGPDARVFLGHLRAGTGPAQLKAPASRASWRDVVGPVVVYLVPVMIAQAPILHSSLGLLPRTPRSSLGKRKAVPRVTLRRSPT